MFATVNHVPSLEWKIATGLVSFAAAILSTLQTFFKLDESAEKHKKAGANYSRLRKDIEIFQVRYGSAATEAHDAAVNELTELARRMSDLALGAPNLNDKYFEAAKREFSA